ncbi:hypothetical protein [Paenibacillus silvae]|uniref:hypothetical protein n=1 Tax=Paenibacillus silvae TaxID=1325358 RepID=UPI00164265FC|nr:hypothetical protein [Paenibacillus silvae]
MAASDNADMKKIQKGYYGGGAHSNEWSTSYNFDLKTGKRIYLNHVAQTSQQKYNLNISFH